MRRMWMFWTAAIVITLAAAVYQRMTGPTYPVRGTATVEGATFAFRLPRSGTTGSDQAVELTTGKPGLRGTLVWRRYRSDDPWTTVRMEEREGRLTAAVPQQPPAGKLEYRLAVAGATGETWLTPQPVVIRFKGAV